MVKLVLSKQYHLPSKCFVSAKKCLTKKENYKKKSMSSSELEHMGIDMLENAKEFDRWFIGSFDPSCKVHMSGCVCYGCQRITALAVEMEDVFTCHRCHDEATNPSQHCSLCSSGDCKSVQLRPKAAKQAWSHSSIAWIG
ncbi:unnamed protein product [Polarella glacialis]|uniref:Uncharacterized protein n=1 Tax=Polarella glacialis TaxID=89957 RepID=A0A813K8X8_POLGL|nr:unnamed protein product [Polarella glacialis]